MAHLYAIEFSNGLVKVGRAADANARMAQHGDRLSVAGITIARSHAAECVGDVTRAEIRLIKKCSLAAATRSKFEWFTGLEFEAVANWVNEEASRPEEARQEPRFRPWISPEAASAAAIHYCRACSGAQDSAAACHPYLCNTCFGAGYRFSSEKVGRLILNGNDVPLWSATDASRAPFPGVACEELSPAVGWVRMFDAEWPLGRPLVDPSPSERSTASITQSDIDTYVRPCSRGVRRDGPSNRREGR